MKCITSFEWFIIGLSPRGTEDVWLNVLQFYLHYFLSTHAPTNLQHTFRHRDRLFHTEMNMVWLNRDHTHNLAIQYLFYSITIIYSKSSHTVRNMLCAKCSYLSTSRYVNKAADKISKWNYNMPISHSSY